jgi:AcrR family transcriptional regulator
VPTRRKYGELDRAEVVTALRSLVRREGVQRVTMRGLAAELGAAAPSVYYHVPNKQAALDMLAEAVLSEIPVPGDGTWQQRLIEMYCMSRKVIGAVPGIAAVLQTNGYGERARELDRRSRELIAEAGLPPAAVEAAHEVLYTFLLGSITLRETRSPTARRRSERQADLSFRAGLDVIVAGIAATAEHGAGHSRPRARRG